MADRLSAPDLDELEISLFGPGFGEAIAIHLGYRHWLIVDSCNQPGSRAPAPLGYLLDLGVEVANDVLMIVATHWHDDHVKGIGATFKACSAARFVLSSALDEIEFRQLVRLFSDNPPGGKLTSGLSELAAVFEILDERKPPKAKIYPGELAIEGYSLLRPGDLTGTNGQPLDVELIALSPSPSTVALARQEFNALRPPAGGRVPSPNRNQASVALWGRVAGAVFLLGADLEDSQDPTVGWAAVLNGRHLTRQAGVYKVSHHGAQSGHVDRLWTHGLEAEPRALIAPYSRGNQSLPKDTDVARLRSLTPHAMITVPPRWHRTKWSQPVVRDMVKERSEQMYEAPAQRGWGQIRLRCKIGQAAPAWNVEMFSDACHLRDLTVQQPQAPRGKPRRP